MINIQQLKWNKESRLEALANLETALKRVDGFNWMQSMPNINDWIKSEIKTINKKRAVLTLKTLK